MGTAVSAGIRVPLAEAELTARQLVGLLGLGCEKIEVGGSIRRKALDVGDIEIVAIPRVHTERLREGLFEDRDVLVDEMQVVIDSLLADGTLHSHPDDPKRGPRYSKLVHTDSGIQVDLFSARADTWGLIFLIRTGPATYSQWLVTEARARRFHVVNGEFHRGSMGCGAIPCPVVPTFTEEDVFAALQIHSTAPENRA